MEPGVFSGAFTKWCILIGELSLGITPKEQESLPSTMRFDSTGQPFTNEPSDFVNQAFTIFCSISIRLLLIFVSLNLGVRL